MSNIDWKGYQREVCRWRAENFPANTLLGQIAGAAGELCGEALQSALKMEDGRVDREDHRQKIIDGFGDTLIYMMGACDHLGIDLEICFLTAWREVRRRQHAEWHKKTAVPPVAS